MKKVLRSAVIVFLGLTLLGIIIFGANFFRKRGAGILIETSPNSIVFIDGLEVGKTPYKAVVEPKEVVVKLVPESFEKPLSPYEVKINLVPDVQTYIKRNFGETEDLSSGAIVSFEKINAQEAALAVVSIPDSSQISLDGSVKGFAPFKTEIKPGDYKLEAGLKGFDPNILNIKAISGYTLTAVVKLAPGSVLAVETQPQGTPEPEIVVRDQVEILDTGTGFLRVRSSPSTSAEEVGRVEPGEKYPLIERDEKTGWFKIEYQNDNESSIKEGWVTNQFAKKVEG